MSILWKLLIVLPLIALLSLFVPGTAPAATDISQVAKILGFQGQMCET